MCDYEPTVAQYENFKQILQTKARMNSRQYIGQGVPESTPVESGSHHSMNQEDSAKLASALSRHFRLFNYDDAFLRCVIIGFIGYFYENNISYDAIIKGEPKKIVCPVFYSQSGKQQAVSDQYLNVHQFYNSGDKIEGIYNQIPSGTFTISNVKIQNQTFSGGHERIQYTLLEETPLGYETITYASLGFFAAQEMSAQLTIKCSSEIERMKLHDQIITTYYKVKKYFISFSGIQAIPVHIEFPESSEGLPAVSFRTNESQELELKYNLILKTSFPILDYSTQLQIDRRVLEFGIMF